MADGTSACTNWRPRRRAVQWTLERAGSPRGDICRGRGWGVTIHCNSLRLLRATSAAYWFGGVGARACSEAKSTSPLYCYVVLVRRTGTWYWYVVLVRGVGLRSRGAGDGDGTEEQWTAKWPSRALHECRACRACSWYLHATSRGRAYAQNERSSGHAKKLGVHGSVCEIQGRRESRKPVQEAGRTRGKCTGLGVGVAAERRANLVACTAHNVARAKGRLK